MIGPIVLIVLGFSLSLYIIISKINKQDKEYSVKIAAYNALNDLAAADGISDISSRRFFTRFISDVQRDRLTMLYDPNKLPLTVPFSAVTGCEIRKNGAEVRQGGITRAVVGGALAGGAGAVVGATTAPTGNLITGYEIVIYLADIENPSVIYNLFALDPEREKTLFRTSKRFQEMEKYANNVFAVVKAITVHVERKKYVPPVGSRPVGSRLVTCPDCGKQVSSRANVCPGCGCPASDFPPMLNESVQETTPSVEQQ